MSADKRALDDLDALFRAVPAVKAPRKRSPVPAGRPHKKKKDDMATHTPVGGMSRGCTAPTAELSRATGSGGCVYCRRLHCALRTALLSSIVPFIALL